MKTLYLSDLDGTLLTPDAALSHETTARLQRLLTVGVHFSVATARTAATVTQILKQVPIADPIVLMNGVLIYDMQRGKYLQKAPLTEGQVSAIHAAMRATDVGGMLYGLPDGALATYYEQISNPAMESFITERVQKYNKRFTQTDNLSAATADPIYFCFIDHLPAIDRLYEAIRMLPGLHIERYPDIYSDGDIWYMEVFSEAASKYNAVQYLRTHCGYDRIVAFGDNLNDLPLFAACDACYAVENAKDAVKAAATAVIGPNTRDSVVKTVEALVYGSEIS